MDPFIEKNKDRILEMMKATGSTTLLVTSNGTLLLPNKAGKSMAGKDAILVTEAEVKAIKPSKTTPAKEADKTEK